MTAPRVGLQGPSSCSLTHHAASQACKHLPNFKPGPGNALAISPMLDKLMADTGAQFTLIQSRELISVKREGHIECSGGQKRDDEGCPKEEVTSECEEPTFIVPHQPLPMLSLPTNNIITPTLQRQKKCQRGIEVAKPGSCPRMSITRSQGLSTERPGHKPC